MPPQLAELLHALDRLYDENCTQARHHESERSTVSNMMVAVAAGVLALVTFDESLNQADWPLTAFLVLIGLFGAVFTLKLYERSQAHTTRARAYRSAWDSLLPSVATCTPPIIPEYNKGKPAQEQIQATTVLLALKELGDKTHKREYPVLSATPRLYQTWIAFHLVIAALGAYLTVEALRAAC